MPLFIKDQQTLELNVNDFGADPTGVADSTSAFNAAITRAQLSGQPTRIKLPGALYQTGPITPVSNVYFDGSGPDATMWQLKPGNNQDLLSAQTSNINLAASFGTGVNGTLHTFGISNMTLDGNKSNQTGTSYVLHWYAYDWYLDNVVIQNGLTENVLVDWNGPGTPTPHSMEAHIRNVRCWGSGGIGWQMGGPHDSQISDSIFHQTGSHCAHFAPNAVAVQCSNSHFWGSQTGNNSVAALVEAQVFFTNCEFEGSDVVQVVLLGSESTIVGGSIFGAGTFTTSGIQIGQTAGGTPYNGSVNQSGGLTTAVVTGGYQIQTHFRRCEGTNGAVWFVNDGGGNIFSNVFNTAGSAFSSSGIGNKTVMMLPATGQTPDGTQAKGGAFIMPINAFSAMVARDGITPNDVFNLNTMSGSYKFEMPNGGQVKGYSDAYSTVKYFFNSDGNGSSLIAGAWATGQSATAPALASSGTITTSGVGIARVAPTGAVTGIILQAGTTAGQEVFVLNEAAAANTITFNTTPATSNVANSATATAIAGGTGRLFKWDSSTSRWYQTS